jgi:hypothetical protein
MLRTTFSREQPESLYLPIFAQCVVPLSHCQPGIFPLTGDPPLAQRFADVLGGKLILFLSFAGFRACADTEVAGAGRS